ncbi:MAG: FAD-binding protein [Deltaproteobacteria bacterium]|nr:FAD-binding protein [Deltaproteobacteria bacterium]
MMLDDSLDRWRDLIDWGAIGTDKFGKFFKKQVKAHDVTMIERTMLTDLIKEDGLILGAVGFSIDRPECVAVLAKAVIMCAGAGGYKPHGFPISNMTFDGDAMAYRAGAPISGKEFSDTHHTSGDNPGFSWGIGDIKWGPGIVKTPPPRPPIPGGKSHMGLNAFYSAHEGGAPLIGVPPMGGPQGPYPGFKYKKDHAEPMVMVGGGSTGMAVHKAEGIVPADSNCGTDLPGLFAAGDALSSMLCGGRYSGIGFSFCGSAVQGARAGKVAAKYASGQDLKKVEEDRIIEIKEKIFAPLRKDKGFSSAWATQMLQAATFPYYVLYMKNEDRLLGALANIRYLAENCVPKLFANDPHELRNVHETDNMILNAEMKLRASLFRKESRGAHFREDYPARDDKNFLAWVHLYQGENSSMQIRKVPIPEDWKPPADMPYEDRYVDRFPGELEFLNR